MPNTKKTVGIYTLGCKVNQYESEAIAEELIRSGLEITPPSRVCDAYIINTCTVTAESDRKARQFIRRAITKNPRAFIGVTGCLAQTAADGLCEIHGVDIIVGNTDKLRVAKEIAMLLEHGKKPSAPKVFVGDIDSAEFEQMNITSFDRTRAYIKIEDGCENHCAYCIIPTARGKVRSKRPEAVLSEVRGFVSGGCKEVVLTGIETASYGKDLPCATLSSLLAEVDKIDGIGRVRLGSLDPSLIKETFVNQIAPLRSLAPHFHLSLQSGSSRILALMKRKYNADQAMRAIELLRARIPNVQFTTDVIVGFPGETEDDFTATYEFVKQARFLNVHIFPYSKRAGTVAAKMNDQLPSDVKSERLHRLEELVRSVRAELLFEEIARMPQREVLFETYKNGIAYGHTSEFLEVAVKSDRPLHTEICSVELTDTDGNICFGRII